MAEFPVAAGCESPCHPASSLSVCQTGLHSLGGLAVEAAFAAFFIFSAPDGAGQIGRPGMNLVSLSGGDLSIRWWV